MSPSHTRRPRPLRMGWRQSTPKRSSQTAPQAMLHMPGKQGSSKPASTRAPLDRKEKSDPQTKGLDLTLKVEGGRAPWLLAPQGGGRVPKGRAQRSAPRARAPAPHAGQPVRARGAVAARARAEVEGGPRRAGQQHEQQQRRPRRPGRRHGSRAGSRFESRSGSRAGGPCARAPPAPKLWPPPRPVFNVAARAAGHSPGAGRPLLPPVTPAPPRPPGRGWRSQPPAGRLRPRARGGPGAGVAPRPARTRDLTRHEPRGLLARLSTSRSDFEGPWGQACKLQGLTGLGFWDPQSPGGAACPHSPPGPRPPRERARISPSPEGSHCSCRARHWPGFLNPTS